MDALIRPSHMIGLAVWVTLGLSSFSPRVHLGIIEVLFLLAPWLVVPLGADLIEVPEAKSKSRLRDWVLFTAASFTTISFFLNNRVAASMFASCWLFVCVGFAADAVLRLRKSGASSLTQFCFAAGEGYLLVAGCWLVASRAGLHPLGFQEPIVLLTGVHFHFAGFASAVLAGLTYERLRASNWRLLLQAVLLAVVCGPGVLGLAFLLGPKWKLVAALLVAIGQISLAVAMIRVGIAATNGIGRGLLFVAGASVAVGMVLAAVWALGEYPLQAFVNIRQMAEFHGALNAVGFVACGLTGWRVLSSK